MSASEEDPYSAAGGVEGYTGSVPAIPQIGNIQLGDLAPVLGVAGGEEPDYLDYNIRGRPYSEKLFLNTGGAYMGGIAAGGVYGLFEGLRNSPSPRLRIRLNSVLNACGRRGSRLGNALGVLAVMYTSFESVADTVELEQYAGGHDIVNPIAAALATGILYKSTAGGPTAMLAGVVGSGLVVVGAFGSQFVASQMGQRRLFS